MRGLLRLREQRDLWEVDRDSIWELGRCESQLLSPPFPAP